MFCGNTNPRSKSHIQKSMTFPVVDKHWTELLREKPTLRRDWFKWSLGARAKNEFHPWKLSPCFCWLWVCLSFDLRISSCFFFVCVCEWVSKNMFGMSDLFSCMNLCSRYMFWGEKIPKTLKTDILPETNSSPPGQIASFGFRPVFRCKLLVLRRGSLGIIELNVAQQNVRYPLVVPNIAGWNITVFDRKYIFKWTMFHCYVGLPECRYMRNTTLNQ